MQESFTEMSTDTTHFLPKDQFLQESNLLDTKMMLWFNALTHKERCGGFGCLVVWFWFFVCLFVCMYVCLLFAWFGLVFNCLILLFVTGLERATINHVNGV